MPYTSLSARGFSSASWGMAEQKSLLGDLNKKCIPCQPKCLKRNKCYYPIMLVEQVAVRKHQWPAGHCSWEKTAHNLFLKDLQVSGGEVGWEAMLHPWQRYVEQEQQWVLNTIVKPCFLYTVSHAEVVLSAQLLSVIRKWEQNTSNVCAVGKGSSEVCTVWDTREPKQGTILSIQRLK